MARRFSVLTERVLPRHAVSLFWVTCALGCAASYGPAPLEPERPIAVLSEDEWRVLCRWVNSRRPDYPSGERVCLDYDPEEIVGPEAVVIVLGDPVDFCALRDQVRAETVGELEEVVECHSRWRERRAEFARGVPNGCGCGELPQDLEREVPHYCEVLPCNILPIVFAAGWGECYDGPNACPHECGCTCYGLPRECGD
ncbi:MAG: hypothetical protein H6722_22910 [Sandaracinus sp.]|nr:hypothetical protein [Sandaracinus sp.]MCB9615294.1 hypothetical protein [Sandaracinus sp.]MCB9621528.1 hypothetical protein [Sandaracinus sp.]MCB9622455.1 hypothetical protein [Sandaracinus sp.]